MRVVWVTQWFPPDLGALPARLTEMAQEWVRQGHHVTVVTSFPHHPLGRIPPSYQGRWVVEEETQGLRVVRCWLWAQPNRRMWQRTACQLSFAATSVLLALFRPVRPDVVIVSSPPFFQVASGWIFARARRVPFVFEVRDLWPAVFLASGVMRPGAVYSAFEWMERWFYRAADHVVVVTGAFRDDLVERGVPAAKISVVPNGAALDTYMPGAAAPTWRDRLGGTGKLVVLYAGVHGLATGLEQVLDAAEALRDRTELAFAFVGEGAEREALMAEAARRGLGNTTFLPAVPKSEMPALYASSDICIVCLKPIPLFAKFVPSKLFEVLAAGRPLVAALAGEAADIAARAGGVVVPPGQGARLAAALDALASDPLRREAMARQGRQFVEAHYDRRQLATRYLDVLERVVSPVPPRRETPPTSHRA